MNSENSNIRCIRFSPNRYGIWLVGTRSIVEVERFKYTQDHALRHMQQTAHFIASLASNYQKKIIKQKFF